jgi:uncharacterized cofD-like protein
MDRFKWLYPGMRVKRWIFLAICGAVLLGAGLVAVTDTGLLTGAVRMISFWDIHMNWLAPVTLTGLVFMIIGLTAVIFGFRNTIKSITEVLIPENAQTLSHIIYEKQYLKKGPKIVVIGGGTGLSTMLRGLKHYTSNITAIVTMADDGGSSGQLRGELGILPPGDIRNCLVALADTESLMEELFQHRFSNCNGLSGHSVGNLFIAGMTQIAGDFQTAVKEMGRVLAIRGQVLPVTLKHVILCAELENGTIIEGESNIPRMQQKINRVFLRPGDCEPVPEAFTAIAEADLIILGPGSLYTSVIPNLLVRGVADAVAQSPAVTVYACNIMTQPGETDGYTASDHIRAIHQHAGSGLIDYAIVNVEDIPRKLLRKYRNDGAIPVRADIKEMEQMKVVPVCEDLIFESDVVRHDSVKLAGAIIGLIGHLRGRNEKFHLPEIHLVKGLKKEVQG